MFQGNFEVPVISQNLKLALEMSYPFCVLSELSDVIMRRTFTIDTVEKQYLSLGL